MDMNVAVSIAFSISGSRSLKFAEVMSIFLRDDDYKGTVNWAGVG